MPVTTKRKRGKQYAGPPAKKFKIPPQIQKAVQRQVVSRFNKMVESKRSVHTSNDGSQIGHNDFIIMDGNLLETTQGVKDPNNAGTENRIGDEIMLNGISIKYMVELNERYSDVTFRMFVVKKAKGDTLSAATFFTGISGNKMIDTINTERFTVVASKTFKVTAANSGANVTIGTGGFGDQNDVTTVMSRATRIMKLWIPGTKFGRKGRVVYENGTSQPKFFDYQVIIYAYSNYTTSQGQGWFVGRVNDYVRTLHYKDA
jgi:hypothetical protein